MQRSKRNWVNRRAFLRDSLRRTALTGLAAVSALLVKRNGGRLVGQTCINGGVCPRCTVYADCGLPAALSRKQATTQRKNPGKQTGSRAAPESRTSEAT